MAFKLLSIERRNFILPIRLPVLFPLYFLPFIYRVLSMHLVLLDSRFMSLDQPCSRLVSSLLECGMSRRYVALHITSSAPNLSRGIHHPSMQEQYSHLLMKACDWKLNYAVEGWDILQLPMSYIHISFHNIRVSSWSVVCTIKLIFVNYRRVMLLALLAIWQAGEFY